MAISYKSKTRMMIIVIESSEVVTLWQAHLGLPTMHVCTQQCSLTHQLVKYESYKKYIRSSTLSRTHTRPRAAPNATK